MGLLDQDCWLELKEMNLERNVELLESDDYLLMKNDLTWLLMLLVLCSSLNFSDSVDTASDSTADSYRNTEFY